ncbi:MAG: T9SS type A sorting domain-containing protein [Candidatus Stygibacter frigidus]|nr:T9SS type A sorting domain-containing protein [Candidatus Stygibacter frigidus]
MRILFILSLILFTSMVWGFQFEAGSGIDVSRIERENEAAYHTSEDDRHFYYTYPEADNHQWAVEFDFKSYFSNVDSLTFTPSSAWIYLPNFTVSGNMTAGLYQAGSNGPGVEITSGTLNNSSLIAGWNEIDLSAAAADTLIWLVVNYPTGLGNQQYISASNGDGSHSYYWDPYYGEEGSWMSMSASGFANEFLFTLSGEFHFMNIDIEVSDFYLEGTFAAGEEIFPRATIHNNSSVSVDSLSVVIKKEFPGDTHIDTLYVYDIAAGNDIELSDIDDISYILSSYPGQYKFSTTLYCNGDLPFSNNSIVINKNTFNFSQPSIMLENMVELDDTYTYSIWTTQNGITDYQLLPINYFPNYQDINYYNTLAEERFHYYELYNLPATVICGDPLIGFDTFNYEDHLLEKFAEIDSLHSFVMINDITALVDTLEEVYVTVLLDPGENLVMTSLASSCEIYGMIYEEGLPLDEQLEGKVFLDTLKFAAAGLSGLANGVPVEKQTRFNKIYKFTPISGDLDNCRLLFWVQNTTDNTIWATGEISFSDFGEVGTSDDEISPAPAFVAYPNPYNLKGNMQIKLPEKVSRSSIQINIYNIKGQIVRNLSAGELNWDGYDNQQHLACNGIYFMQINHSSSKDWLKVMVVK